MKIIHLLALATLLLLCSCGKDFGTTKVTYQKATGIYNDLQEIRATPLNADIQPVINPGKIFIGENHILLGEENKGIHVIDNSNPSNPTFINFIQLPGNKEFFVKDNIIYGESYYDMVQVDVTDLNNAKLISRAENVFEISNVNAEGHALTGFTFEEVSEELDQRSDLYKSLQTNNYAYFNHVNELIPNSAVPSSFAGTSGNQTGTVNRISVANDHMYIIGKSEINILSIQGGLTKVNEENISWSNDMETIFAHENNIFIGSQTAMEIYDASNPVNLQQRARFDHATSCDPVLPNNGVAYVTLRTADFSDCPGNVNALLAIDITDLNNPIQREEVVMQSPFGMTIQNDKLFVCEGENGLKIFDISNKVSPQLIETITSVKAYDVILHPTNSNIILLAGPDGLNQYEVTSDYSFTLESTIQF